MILGVAGHAPRSRPRVYKKGRRERPGVVTLLDAGSHASPSGPIRRSVRRGDGSGYHATATSNREDPPQPQGVCLLGNRATDGTEISEPCPLARGADQRVPVDAHSAQRRVRVPGVVIGILVAPHVS